MAQIICKDLTLGYDNQAIVEHLNFSVHAGDYLCIIGENGTGKTTLLKILTGNLLPDKGECRLGANVTIGYYDQEQQLFQEKK